MTLEFDPYYGFFDSLFISSEIISLMLCSSYWSPFPLRAFYFENVSYTFCICVCQSVCLSGILLCVSECLCVCLFIHQSHYLSIYQSLSLSICPSICLPIYLFILLSFNLSVNNLSPSIHLFFHLSIDLSIYLSISTSLYSPSIFLSMQMSQIIHSQAGQLASQRHRSQDLQQSLQDELAVSQQRIAFQEREILGLKKCVIIYSRLVRFFC